MSKIAEDLNKAAEENAKSVSTDWIKTICIENFKLGAIYSSKDTIERIREEVERLRKELYFDTCEADYFANDALDNVERHLSELEKEYEL